MGLGAVIETIALRYEKGKDLLLRKGDLAQGVIITEGGIYTGTYMRVPKMPFGYGTMKRFKVNCTEFDFDSLSNATYKGFWLDGQPYGNGILYTGYGDIYSGVFRGYYSINNATVVYSNGDIYYGDVSHFRHVGYGEMDYITKGKKSKGLFYRNKIRKEVNMSFTDGSSFYGTVTSDGEFSYGTIKRNDGTVYRGELIYWMTGYGFGVASETYIDGSMYKGCFEYGRCEGLGEKHYANGDYYYGSFFEGQPNGFGVYKWVDGRTFYGDFRNGYPLLGILSAHGVNKGVVGYRGNLIDEDEYDDFIKTL